MEPVGTLMSETVLSCPKCEEALQINVYTVLSTDDQTYAFEWINAGKINTLQCGVCGFKGFVPVPFMFADRPHQLYCVYFPYSKLEDPFFYQLFDKDGYLRDMELFQGIQLDCSPHVVFSMQELMLYVHFRKRLLQE